MRVRSGMTPSGEPAFPDKGPRRAWTLLGGRGLHHLLVLEGKWLAGIVADRAIHRARSSRVLPLGVHERFALVDRFPVGEIMIKEIAPGTPDQSVPEAARCLVVHWIGGYPESRTTGGWGFSPRPTSRGRV